MWGEAPRAAPDQGGGPPPGGGGPPAGAAALLVLGALVSAVLIEATKEDLPAEGAAVHAG